MKATQQEQALRSYHLNRIESRIAAYRVWAYQKLCINDVDVSDNLDTAIGVERAMRAAYEQSTADLIGAAAGLLVEAAGSV